MRLPSERCKLRGRRLQQLTETTTTRDVSKIHRGNQEQKQKQNCQQSAPKFARDFTSEIAVLLRHKLRGCVIVVCVLDPTAITMYGCGGVRLAALALAQRPYTVVVYSQTPGAQRVSVGKRQQTPCSTDKLKNGHAAAAVRAPADLQLRLQLLQPL